MEKNDKKQPKKALQVNFCEDLLSQIHTFLVSRGFAVAFIWDILRRFKLLNLNKIRENVGITLTLGCIENINWYGIYEEMFKLWDKI